MVESLHKTVVNLSFYDKQVPVFKTGAERREYERTLGRLILRALESRNTEDTVRQLAIYPDGDGDLMAIYYKTIEASNKAFIDAQGAYERAFVQTRQISEEQGRTFVLGAIKDKTTGDWSFHS